MNQLERKFKSKIPLYQRLKDEVYFIIDEELKKRKIKIHSLLSRIKEFDSFEDKIHRKNTENPFVDITDIVGLRIVCLFLSDFEKIREFINRSFDIHNEDNKLADTEISQFGYQSIHYIVSLKDHCSGPRYDGLRNLVAEVQVRTIAMDAWATISHYLDYKTESDVPRELRKDLYALSGLFYVADTHFQMFYQGSKESFREAIKHDSVDKNLLSLELNLDTLRSYAKAKLKDREISSPDFFSTLLSEIKALGINSIKALDVALDSCLEAGELYEKEMRRKRDLTAVGIIRISLRILYSGSVNSEKAYWRYQKYLKQRY